MTWHTAVRGKFSVASGGVPRGKARGEQGVFKNRRKSEGRVERRVEWDATKKWPSTKCETTVFRI